MAYQLGETFDLARAYAGAEEVKGLQQNQTLRDLQIQAARKDLETPELVSAEDQIGRANLLAGGISQMIESPTDSMFAEVTSTLAQSGVKIPSEMSSKFLALPMEQRVSALKEALKSVEAFRASANPQKVDKPPAAIGPIDPEAWTPASLAAFEKSIDSSTNKGNRELLIPKPTERAPREQPAPTVTEVEDPDNAKRLLRVDARVYRGGGLGSPGVLGVSGGIPDSQKPQTPYPGALGTAAQQARIKRDIDAANVAMGQAAKLENTIGQAVGIGSAARKVTAKAVGQLPADKLQDTYGETLSSQQALAQFGEQTLVPLIKSVAKGQTEQQRLLKLIPQPGAWFTNESQAKRQVNELMEWVQSVRDTNAEALNIDPATLPKWTPFAINDGDSEHDSAVEDAINRNLNPQKK